MWRLGRGSFLLGDSLLFSFRGFMAKEVDTVGQRAWTCQQVGGIHQAFLG